MLGIIHVHNIAFLLLYTPLHALLCTPLHALLCTPLHAHHQTFSFHLSPHRWPLTYFCPPSSSPLVTTTLFSVSMCLFLFGLFMFFLFFTFYMWVNHMVFVFLHLTYFSWYDNLYPLRMALFHPFLQLIFHGISMYHAFFIHSSADGQYRLFPRPGCCKSCFSEHRGACIFSNYGFFQI